MATWGQHKLLNGILIPQFLEEIGMEVTKDNADAVKGMFKKYLDVHSTSFLSEKDMWKFIQAFYMLAAREFSVELTQEQARMTMEELLHQTNTDYEL